MTGKRAFASVAIAFALLLVAAPIAQAQGLPDAGPITDATSATDAVTDTTSGATDTTTGTVDETTDTVDNATGGATGGVTDTVDDTAGSVGETAGNTAGSAGNTVNDATGGGDGNNNDGDGSGVGSITDQVTNTVKDLTGSGGGGSTSGLIDEVLGSGSSEDGSPDLRGLTPDLIDDLVDEASNFGLSPVAAEGWIQGKTVYGANAYRDPAMLLASLTGLLEDFAGDFATGSSGASGDVHFSTNDSGPSLFADAGRAAVVAAKALAFPLALALGVLGFLAIQGRIGRKDPKLALAPVDTTEESLIFE